MRTTVAIDDDLFEKLRETASKRRVPFTRLVNEVLRRGLSGQKPATATPASYCVDTFDSAFRPGVDPVHLNKLLDELEVREKTEPRAR
jgi:hypothetical protein